MAAFVPVRGKRLLLGAWILSNFVVESRRCAVKEQGRRIYHIIKY